MLDSTTLDDVQPTCWTLLARPERKGMSSGRKQKKKKNCTLRGPHTESVLSPVPQFPVIFYFLKKYDDDDDDIITVFATSCPLLVL